MRDLLCKKLEKADTNPEAARSVLRALFEKRFLGRLHRGLREHDAGLYVVVVWSNHHPAAAGRPCLPLRFLLFTVAVCRTIMCGRGRELR